jgi:hypothetical protein
MSERLRVRVLGFGRGSSLCALAWAAERGFIQAGDIVAGDPGVDYV